MYTTPRVAQLRNILVSIGTGGITLIILLIAPLGLATVIINTLLVTVSTYIVSTVADRVLLWLEPGQTAQRLGAPPNSDSNLRRRRD
ncbi:MAG: hypothetical protein IGS39_19070 [Calothrix sp. C42_A2020_038]|nr:hypothetical protein [Calothrix sp. C42_A2020_038]